MATTTSKRRSASAAIFAAGLVAAAASHASSIGVLPIQSAVSYEYFGLNYAEYEATSSAIGTLTYTGGPGCAAGGVCSATTALGADPSASISLDEVPFEGGAGGGANAIIGYFFTPSATGTVYLHSNDVMVSPASGADSQATVIVGTAASYGSPYYLNYYSSILYQDTDCVNGCQSGVANYTSPAPLPANQALSVVGGTEYYVYESIYIGDATNAGQLFAEADPSITSGTAGLTLTFSPGVISSVPEPLTWVLMLLSLSAIGLTQRVRRGVSAAT